MKILSWLPASWTEALVRKYAGVWVAKGLAAAAAYLVTHGLMQDNQSAPWVGTNTQVIVGAILAAVTAYLSHLREQNKQADLVTAHQTPAALPIYLPPVTVDRPLQPSAAGQ